MFKINMRIRKNEVSPENVVKRQCLCQTMKLMLASGRIFGLTPLTWSHPRGRQFSEEDAGCTFKVSRPWQFYSILIVVIYNIDFIRTNEFTAQDYAEELALINECIYYIFSSILSIICIFRASFLAKTLNGISPFLRNGLMCQSSRTTLIRAQRIGLTIIMLQLFVQYVVMFYMGISDNFTTHLESNDFVSRVIHNIPFIFYFQFCSISAMYVSLFMCYDTTMIQALRNEVIKPAEGQLSVTEHKRCTGQHEIPEISRCFARDLDCLRRFHERICVSLRTANLAFNPQITLHLSIELAVIVMHWYSVILFMNYDVVTPVRLTIHFLDWLFLLVHIIGLIIFLTVAQKIPETHLGPLQYLIEYSNSFLTPEEHIQIRLFASKLRLTPAEFTAGTLFPVGIGLLAPISGSIVTYVLVVLQFELHAPSTTESDISIANDTFNLLLAELASDQ